MIWWALAWADPGLEPAPVEELAPSVWVAAVEYPTGAFERVIKQAVKLGAEVEPVALGIRCLRFETPPPADWLERAGRRLGSPLEARETCSVARYPQGEGWWVAQLGADPELEERIEASLGALGMSVLAQPMDGRPASLCVSAMQITRSQLETRLERGSIDVQGVWAVGSCTSRVHSVPLRP